MANQHLTLTSLFTDLANSIRKVMGSSNSIVADTMPDVLNTMERININNQFSTAISGISFSEITQAFTPTVFKYYGGWWWLAGNASNGATMWARSNNLQIWTVVNLNASYPVMGIGFSGDLDYLWIWSNKNASSNRFVIRIQNPTTFTSGSYTFWTNSTYSFTDACSVNGGIWAVTGTKSTYSVLSSTPSALNGAYTHSSITQNYYKCSNYGNAMVAISQNGYYTWKTSSNTPYTAGEEQIDSGIATLSVSEMNNYLCVIATKNNASYLYYTNGTLGNLSWNSIKINDSLITPIGMGYANNLYVIGYIKNNILNFWCCNSLSNFSSGFCMSDIHLENQNNNGILMTSDNNSYIATIFHTNNVSTIAYYFVSFF